MYATETLKHNTEIVIGNIATGANNILILNSLGNIKTYMIYITTNDINIVCKFAITSERTSKVFGTATLVKIVARFIKDRHEIFKLLTKKFHRGSPATKLRIIISLLCFNSAPKIYDIHIM
jgi:predicted metallopeptidase